MENVQKLKSHPSDFSQFYLFGLAGSEAGSKRGRCPCGKGKTNLSVENMDHRRGELFFGVDSRQIFNFFVVKL